MLSGDERLDRLGVHPGDEFVGFLEHTGARDPIVQGGAFDQRLPQQRALGARVGR
jgi:hypothetical protein